MYSPAVKLLTKPATKCVTRLVTTIVFTLLVAGCGSSLFQSRGDQSGNDNTNLKKIDPDAQQHRPLGTKTRKARARLYKPASAISLEIPPDLITTTDPMVLQNLADNALNEVRVLPEIVGARIVQKDGVYGLEVDTSVESAWKTVTQFWGLSNINLVEYNPEAGTMETEWIEEPQVDDEDASYFRKIGSELLTSLTKRNTALDKYRIRFERISADQSHIHVSHRSSARKEISSQSLRKISEFEWVELSSNPNRVADFLQHLILVFDDSEASRDAASSN